MENTVEIKAEVEPRSGSNQLCRVCLARGIHLKCLHTDKELSVQSFLDFFTVLTTVQVNSADGLSKHICQSCIDKIHVAYEVRKLAHRSDVALRAVIVCTESNYLDFNPNKKPKELMRPSEKKKKYVCGLCAKIFSYRSELERHKQTHAPHFKCGTCNKVFGFKSSLRRHERQHLRAGRVQCPQCLSLFKDEHLLKRHIQYAHQGARYECGECGARVGSASALRAHARRHTARADRPLRCRHAAAAGCARAFNFQHQRRRHEATHTGDKYHHCDHCGAGFVQAHHLASHMATHQPELQIPCTVSGCLKTFHTRYGLKKHLAVHKKKKMLVCSTCGEQLSTVRSLRSHVRLCHSSAINVAAVKDTILCNTCGKMCARTYLKKHQLKCHQKATPVIEFNNNNALRLSREKQISTTPEQDCRAVQDVFKVMDGWHAVSKHNRSWINDAPKEDVTIMQSSEESECTSQEVVRDIVDMMEGNHQNVQDYTEQLCHGNRDVSNNIEDAIEQLHCNGCCQNVPSAKGKPLERLRSCEAFKSRVDGEGRCKNTTHVHKEINSKNISREDNVRPIEENIMERSDCKEFLGKCIVSTAGGDCICAKVSCDQEAPLPEYLTTPLLEALEKQGYYPS